MEGYGLPVRRLFRARQATSIVALAPLLPLVGLACASPPPPAEVAVLPPPDAAPTPAPASAGAPRPDVDALARAANQSLLPYAQIDPTASLRVDLYTWTTREQVDALAKDRVLLTRDRSPIHGASYVEQVLDARAKQDRLAALLRTKAFARARFAWTAPWATLQGWPGESYGDRLVRVTLKPDAWVVVVRTSLDRLEVRDLDGKSVAADEAVLHPERIAAIYFVHDASRRGAASTKDERLGYREIVLCNESMIASFAVETETEKKAVDDAARAIDALVAYVEAEPSSSVLDVLAWNRTTSESWHLNPPKKPAEPLQMYADALAFPNEHYLPVAERLRALGAALHAIVFDTARGFTHAPNARFVAADARLPVSSSKPPAGTMTKPRRRKYGGGTY